MAYASTTEVAVEKSMMEITTYLKKQLAKNIVVTELDSPNVAVILFELKNRRVKYSAPIPKNRGTASAYQQSLRTLWRRLLLSIKSDFAAIESGIKTFDGAFLANTMLPSNQTVGEWLAPQIEQVYNDGKMPPILPGATLLLPAPK